MSLETPDKIRSLQRKLYCKAKAEPAFAGARSGPVLPRICLRGIGRPMPSTRAQSVVAVGLAVKPVGKPDAGNPHVRLCVQVRLACSAGDSPVGAKVRTP